MKRHFIVFCSVALVSTISIFAYNSHKGPAREKDGISEVGPIPRDSLVSCGRELLKPLHRSDQDLKAIAAYVNKH